MIRTFGRFALLVSLAAGMSVAGTVQNWTGPSDGDTYNMYMTFTGFTANQLTSIYTDGAYYHDHGMATTFTLDLELNGVWTTVRTISTGGTDLDNDLTDFAPATFATSTVTGLRFTDTPEVSNGYHGFTGATAFTFDTVAAVPEPGTVALLGLGLGAMALRRFRRA